MNNNTIEINSLSDSLQKMPDRYYLRLLAAALMGLAVAGGTSAAQPAGPRVSLSGKAAALFNSASAHPAGQFPNRIVVADFNGDGIKDIASADGTGVVNVLLGTQKGGFAPPIPYTAGQLAESIAVADFNHDGKADLAVADALGNQVEILLGNGDGTFQSPLFYPGVDYPVSIAITDFNRDGILDAVVVQGHLNSVAVSLGLPQGGFAAPISYPLPQVALNSQLVVADFNGDGKPDVAVANAGAAAGPGHSVSVFLGAGDGTLGPSTDFDIGSQPFDITVADFNNDGKEDLATANYFDGTASVLIGNGDGTFQPHVDYQAGAPFSPVGISSIKFSDKDNLGLVVAGASGVAVLVGNGDGTFTAGGSYDPPGGKLAVGDFNKDGNKDVAVTDYGKGQVNIFFGKGHGQFKAPHAYFTGEGPNDAAQADFNEDGIPDVVTANPDGVGDISLFLGNGDGTFQPATSIKGGAVPGGIAVGDVNGDHHADIVAVNELSPDGSVTVLLGNGHGKFHPGQTIAAGDLSYAATLADLNGDGKLDIAVANFIGNNVSILIGNGDGTFQKAVNYPAGTSPDAVVAFDANGDGILDLAVANRVANAKGIGLVSLLIGNGNGTFKPAVTTKCGSLPNSIAVGDFDGDGKLDMAVANSGENDVSILFGNGDGTFKAPHNFSTGDGDVAPWRVSTADFDGDGNLDLATANAGDGLGNTVSVLLGNGRGKFSAPSLFLAGFDTHTVVVGDFDQNGAPDLAVANSLENTISILLNKSSTK